MKFWLKKKAKTTWHLRKPFLTILWDPRWCLSSRVKRSFLRLVIYSSVFFLGEKRHFARETDFWPYFRFFLGQKSAFSPTFFRFFGGFLAHFWFSRPLFWFFSRVENTFSRAQFWHFSRVKNMVSRAKLWDFSRAELFFSRALYSFIVVHVKWTPTPPGENPPRQFLKVPPRRGHFLVKKSKVHSRTDQNQKYPQGATNFYKSLQWKFLPWGGDPIYRKAKKTPRNFVLHMRLKIPAFIFNFLYLSSPYGQNFIYSFFKKLAAPRGLFWFWFFLWWTSILKY